ncbi:MAG: hypothetical protein WCJ72_19015, partial [Chryseobacterium sp.]
MAEFRTEEPGEKAKLLLPPLNISALANPELRFSLANVNWFGDIDELRIFYMYIRIYSYRCNISNN